MFRSTIQLYLPVLGHILSSPSQEQIWTSTDRGVYAHSYWEQLPIATRTSSRPAEFSPSHGVIWGGYRRYVSSVLARQVPSFCRPSDLHRLRRLPRPYEMRLIRLGLAELHILYSEFIMLEILDQLAISAVCFPATQDPSGRPTEVGPTYRLAEDFRQHALVRTMRRLSGRRNGTVVIGRAPAFPLLYIALCTNAICAALPSHHRYSLGSSLQVGGLIFSGGMGGRCAELCRGSEHRAGYPRGGGNREHNFVITPFVPTLDPTILLGSGRRAFPPVRRV